MIAGMRFVFALVLAVPLVLGSLAGVRAGQDDARLPGLFAALRAAPPGDAAERLQAEIWRIWLESRDPSVELLMLQGVAAMQQGALAAAIGYFDAMVARAPGFAEAWNKRATVHFMVGDFDASVADIERTLALEPQHWGALAGLGQIYLALGAEEPAVRAFRRALTINPHLDGVRQMLDRLEQGAAKRRI